MGSEHQEIPVLDVLQEIPGDSPEERLHNLFDGKKKRMFIFLEYPIMLKYNHRKREVTAGENMQLFIPYHNTKVADIESIRANSSMYGPDGPGRGTFFMKLAMRLVELSGVLVVNIDDASRVSVGDASSSLALIRMSQGLNPWYESFGFRPEHMDDIDYIRKVLNLPVISLVPQDFEEKISNIQNNTLRLNEELLHDALAYLSNISENMLFRECIMDLYAKKDGNSLNAVFYMLAPKRMFDTLRAISYFRNM